MQKNGCERVQFILKKPVVSLDGNYTSGEITENTGKWTNSSLITP